MLFTTTTFALLFLPITLLGYFAIGRRSPLGSAAWLLAASLFFYGWWLPEFTLLLVGSIGVNFALGTAIARARLPAGNAGPNRAATVYMILGITFDLALLAYFKYANFLVDNVNAAFGLDMHVGRIVLPIGISFYTFTQIAFLVDTWYGKVAEYRPVHYGLFVTYFPHLIAGPVLHHSQMMPQFASPAVYRFDSANFFAGVSIFCIGLFKKVVLADGVAPYADAIFVAADAGQDPTLQEAWLGALAYTFQLYFDFSGYSDMAVGLSWMFNIRLPFNFDSPYKATSISDFWRRWHISLSTFLRDYLYVPLGGNRKGPVRRYVNLVVTMVLGGLWHGAAWSFVIWGALHGAYLMVNHVFRSACERSRWGPALNGSRLFGICAWALTMLAVIAAWVFFRAHSLQGATRMLLAMGGGGVAAVDRDVQLWNAGLHWNVGMGWCAVLGLVACLAPNSNRLGNLLRAKMSASETWRYGFGASSVACVLFLVMLNAARDTVSAFIYFNF